MLKKYIKVCVWDKSFAFVWTGFHFFKTYPLCTQVFIINIFIHRKSIWNESEKINQHWGTEETQYCIQRSSERRYSMCKQLWDLKFSQWWLLSWMAQEVFSTGSKTWFLPCLLWPSHIAISQHRKPFLSEPYHFYLSHAIILFTFTVP